MRPECVCCGAPLPSPLPGGNPTPVQVIQVLCDECIQEIRELQVQTGRSAEGLVADR